MCVCVCVCVCVCHMHRIPHHSVWTRLYSSQKMDQWNGGMYMCVHRHTIVYTMYVYVHVYTFTCAFYTVCACYIHACYRYLN